ncbi:extracellular solute-binding protein [Butyrivibrio sp. VCB2001]|uniref:extracellular solute-binding protein n=1 Tax=Butyrivibrio sp. VCB2001 TaxID=1280667 RepID=UPI000479CAAF|nr:extracellular solute-binding protein [Butyrivibrio sp. VCB2001]
MHKSRTFLSFIMAACVCFLAVGCASSKESVQSQGSSESTKTLTIAARDGSHADVINAVKGKFEQENNCTVEVIPLSADDIRKNVIEDISNPEGKYDIIMIDDPLMPEYIEKNVLQNLTQLGYADDEDFVDKSRLLGKDPYPLGATYALPFSGNVQLIFYNPDLITDSGSLNTWSDILTACEEVQASGKKGYAIRGQAGNPIVSDFLPILWAFGGDLFDENNKVILDSRKSREALEFYCKLYSTGDNYDKDGLIKAINDGEAAMALGWPSWFITGSGATASIAQIPGKYYSISETFATGEIGNWLLGITTNSKDPQLALKLSIYLTSADVQREALEYGGVPTRKSVFKDDSIIAKYPYFQQLYSGTNNSRVRPRTTKWSQIETVFGEELVKCIEGSQSVDDTIKNSQKAISDLMNE